MASPQDLIDRLLSPAEVRVTIAASPEAVFAVVSDPETYPEWLAGAQRIRRREAAFRAPRTRFDHDVGPTEGATVADDTKALVNDPPHRLQLEVQAGPITGVVDFELTRTADGTEVRFREHAEGRMGLVMPFLRGPVHLRNKASLERLRQRLEPLIIPL
jgi:uncharacterized protein YndB with AHSA1/START domain